MKSTAEKYLRDGQFDEMTLTVSAIDLNSINVDIQSFNLLEDVLVIKKIKELGFKIKLDTNGTNPKVLKELIDNKLIDYVAMDIKTSLNEYHIATGTANPLLDKVKESIDILKTSGIDYEFRTTVVKEFHDREDFRAIAEWLKGFDGYISNTWTNRNRLTITAKVPANRFE